MMHYINHNLINLDTITLISTTVRAIIMMHYINHNLINLDTIILISTTVQTI